MLHKNKMEGYSTVYFFFFGEYGIMERARDKYQEVQPVTIFPYLLRAENHMKPRFSGQHVQVFMSSPVPMRALLPDSEPCVSRCRGSHPPPGCCGLAATLTPSDAAGATPTDP